jgi:tetratricopeptide (TPR) repeat protein
VEKDPNDNSNIEHLGDAYILLGEVDKALECWGKAKQLGSKNKVLDKKIDKKNYYEPVY